MLKSKLHRATVTASDVDYEGSLTIDRELMDAVKIQPYEKILVANLTNGNRLETYAIPAEPGSGTICLNGATAHKGAAGDLVIIFAFCLVPQENLTSHRPLILALDKNNRPAGKLKDIYARQS
jgi:aspartate 1-decarboxylase